VKMIPSAIILLLAGVFMTLGLLACSGFVPAGVMAVLAIPLPAAYVHMRQGAVEGGGVVMLSAIVLALFAGYGEAAGYVIQFGVLSFLLPFFLKRGLAWDISVGLTLAVVLAGGSLILAGVASMEGLDIPAAVQNYLQNEGRQAAALAQNANLSGEQAAQFETLIQQAAAFLQRAYPAVAAIGFGSLLLLTLFGLQRLSHGRYQISGTPFQRWKLPEILIWGLIFSGAGMLFGQGIVGTVSLNLLLVLLAGYFLQGLAIVGHFFKKKGVPPVLRTLGYVLVVTLNPLPVIVTGLGVFDLWVDFRKPRKTKD
jgi:uncharacterized protein YybS (DUF2232 family)